MTKELKIKPWFFEQINQGNKKIELRKLKVLKEGVFDRVKFVNLETDKTLCEKWNVEHIQIFFNIKSGLESIKWWRKKGLLTEECVEFAEKYYKNETAIVLIFLADERNAKYELKK